MTDEKKKKAKKVKAEKPAEVVETAKAEKPKTIKNLLPNTFMIGGADKLVGYSEMTLSDEIKNNERAMVRINRAVEVGVLKWL